MTSRLRSILSLLLILLSTSVSFAQKSEPVHEAPNRSEVEIKKAPFAPRLMLGATGGVNLSNVLLQPSLRQTLHIGYDGGVILRYDVVPYAGIWLEVDYSSRGWTEVHDDLPDYQYDRTINFLNVPVMTHFMIGNGSLKLTIDAGAHFGYYLGEHSTVTPLPEDSEVIPFDKHHEIPVQNPFFWGVGGGIGAEYHFGSHFVGGLRGSYVYGFGDLFKNSRSDIFVKSSEQIIAFKAYLLYAF